MWRTQIKNRIQIAQQSFSKVTVKRKLSEPESHFTIFPTLKIGSYSDKSYVMVSLDFAGLYHLTMLFPSYGEWAGLGVLTFKCVKGLAPSYLCHRFKTRDCVHDRNTRYKNNLNIPAYKSASGQRTFLYRATSFWNSLPCEIRGCDNLPIFKRHLKEFLSSF